MAVVFDYELPVSFIGRNAVSYGFGLNRSYAWDISLEPELKGFYGYGYGNNFYDLNDVGEIDYFHVIGVNGTATGYGILETKGNTIEEYNFGFGYEYAPALLSDDTDNITIKATVTENGSPVPNVKVVFSGTTGSSIFVENNGVTDENGEVDILIRMDNSVLAMRILDDGEGVATTFTKKSSIANVSAITSYSEGNRWSVLLPTGDLPENHYIPYDAYNFDKIRISITDTNEDYSVDKVKPVSLQKREDHPGTNRDIWEIVYDAHDYIESITVDHATLDIFEASVGGTKMEALPLSGWMDIRAYIDERPQSNEKKISVDVVGTQWQKADSVYSLVFNSYGYQTYRAYGYV